MAPILSLLFVIWIFFVLVMFLFYLIFFLLSKRTDGINVSIHDIPKIEDMYRLPTNEQIETLAAQFRQNPNWEHGNMPTSLTEAEETTPIESISHELTTGPGIIKTGHLFNPEDMYAYRINSEGVHPRSEHHIFLVRHGLYLYTEEDSSAHLLRYGKYQARMAGHKINQVIHDLIAKSGPLTRPIQLVSSTQTRAFETLYNIRLQLTNHFEYAPEIIQDTGITESVDPERQRIRWLYFVREYLQPIKSNRREHTITIIASHGNLLTAFDYIISKFLYKNQPYGAFAKFPLPVGTGLSHGETLLYRTMGAEPIRFRQSFTMSEIPITVNHAQLRKDFYYEWAAVHKCRANHGRENMKNYIRAAVLDNVFSTGHFQNTIRNFETILYLEMEHEYDTHILPMIMQTCRSYLYRLLTIQTNTDFESFNRLMSPVPIPETEEEQSSPLKQPSERFNAYGMPFPVENRIQLFRKNPVMTRQQIPPGIVHPESRILLFLIRHDKQENISFFYILRLNVNTGDERTSYLTRLGINQIRGIMSQVHTTIHRYKQRLPKETHILPVQIVAEPSIQSAESCFHVRSLLLSADYTVPEQVTDLGIQFNYFQKKVARDFHDFQRVQILYMLRHYLGPDKNDSTRPSFQVHILCGDGRLFTAFRQQMAMSNILTKPYPRFTPYSDPGYNVLKHGNALFFEAIGADVLKLHDIITLVDARNIPDEQKVVTEHSLQLPSRELRRWLQNPSGPCTLSYFNENIERLSSAIANTASLYHHHVAQLLTKEWDPYLAGLFIYACRLHITPSNTASSCDQQIEGVGTEVPRQCNDGTVAKAGPSGDCV